MVKKFDDRNFDKFDYLLATLCQNLPVNILQLECNN